MTQPSKAQIKQVTRQIVDQCIPCAAFGGCTTKPSKCTVRTMMNKKPIVTNAADENCFISGDEIKTTSLKIAEVFKKQHKDILRKLEAVHCSEDFRRRNFTPSSYVNSQNKKQPMYEIAKDGFMFIVLGFTGKKAENIREAYIKTFNQMARQLHNGTGLAIPQTESQALYLAAQKQEKIEQQDTKMKAVGRALESLSVAFNNLK